MDQWTNRLLAVLLGAATASYYYGYTKGFQYAWVMRNEFEKEQARLLDRRLRH